MKNRIVLLDPTNVVLGTETVSGDKVLKVSVVKTVGGGGSGGTVDQGAAGVDPWLVTGPLTDTQLRASAVPVSGTFFQATQPVSIAGTVTVTGPLTDTQLRATPVPVSGTVGVTQSTSPWVENLTQVGGAAFALGQQLAAASLPVVLTAAQITTLTPPTTVAVTQSTNPWIVAGNKTNNNAAPGATNVGTLPALANAAAPSWTEGNQVGLSVDLLGNLRTSATFSPSGTQDINLKQVGGTTTDLGLGIAGLGTQRVAVSSDSTITATVSFTSLLNQNILIIDLLEQLLKEARATRFAMATWTSEAVAGYGINDFDSDQF